MTRLSMVRILTTLFVFTLIHLNITPFVYAADDDAGMPPICKKEIDGSCTIIEYAVKRFGDDRCKLIGNDAIIKDLHNKIDQIKAPEQRYEITKSAFTQLRERAKALDFEKAQNHLIQRIDMAIAFIISEESGNIAVKAIKDAPTYPGQWKISSHYGVSGYKTFEGKTEDPVNLKDIMPAECSELYKEEYKNLLDPSIEFVKLFAIGLRISNYSTDDIFREIFNKIHVRNQKWNNYFYKALPQYPHEIMLNSIGREDDRLEFGGNKLGPLSLPEGQFIVLHPSAGFEYVGDADSGSRLQPSINIELFGYNWWEWEENGDMKRPFGIVALLTLSERADADSIGYGAMFHYDNKYAVGLTYRDDGGLSITMNIEIGEFFRDNFKKYQDKLKFPKSK